MLNNKNNFKQFCEDAKQHKKIKKQSIDFAKSIFDNFMSEYEKYYEYEEVNIFNLTEVCIQAFGSISSFTYSSTIYTEGISLLLQYLASNNIIEEYEVSGIVNEYNWKQLALEGSIKNACFANLDQCINFIKSIVNSINNMENDALSIIVLCILFWYFPTMDNKHICTILKTDCSDTSGTIVCDGVKVKLSIKHYQYIKAFKALEYYQGLTINSRKFSFHMMPSEYLFRGNKKTCFTERNLTEVISRFNLDIANEFGDKLLIIKGIKNSSIYHMLYENELKEGRITSQNFSKRAKETLKEQGINLTPAKLCRMKDGYFVWRNMYANDLKQEFANK